MKRNPPTAHPSEPDIERRSPRERTLAHLDRLLHRVTAIGTGVVLVWSSRADAQRPPQVCDPLPPPVNCKAPETFRAEVCIAQHTQWKKSGNAWVLELTLSLLETGFLYAQLPDKTPPQPEDRVLGQHAAGVTFAGVDKGVVSVTGAALRLVKAVVNRVDLTLVPDAGSRSITVSVPNPANHTQRFAVVLDLSQPPADRHSVSVRLAPATAR